MQRSSKVKRRLIFLTFLKFLHYFRFQILLAIAAIEVLCASIESKGGRPGDFGWDPANIRPKSPELLEEMQTKELKNGRLAMTAIGGMLFQNLATGQGLIEQLSGNNYL